MKMRKTWAGVAAIVAGALVAALGAPLPALAEGITVNTADELQQYINDEKYDTVTLGADITASINVSHARAVTLDLNGHTLTNVAGKHTINNDGNLTITGEGTVDNVSHARAALYNGTGNVTINGGTFTRSAEAGVAGSNGGNSWYVINNESGTLTMNDGDVKGTSGYSSALRNAGTMNFNGGTIEQPVMIGLKNEGTLVMEGGKVISENGLQNWGTATIDNGEIDGILTDFSYDDTTPGKLEMNGGSVSGDVIVVKYTGATSTPSVSVNGGSVGGAITATTGASANPENNAPSDEVANNVEVSRGVFSDSSVAKFVKDGSAAFYAEGKFNVSDQDEVDSVATNVIEVNGAKIYFVNDDDAKTFAKENNVSEDDIERLVYNVSFETNGHGDVKAVKVKAGNAVGTLPAVPEVDGYTAAGWYNGDTKVDETFVPTADVTLVAKWTKNAAPKPADEGTKPAGDKKADAPKKALPQTGDTNNMVVPAVIAIAGVAIVVVAVALRHRKN